MKPTLLLAARSTLFLAVGLTCASPAFGQIPSVLSYQGNLEENGNPVNGVRDLTFRLYAAPSGGSELWTETQLAVPITEGAFAVALGAVTPLSGLAFDVAYWLGVQVGGGAELDPRTALLSVPYALRAALAEGVALPFHGATGSGTGAFSATHTATSGYHIGVSGVVNATSGIGTGGWALASSGRTYGVYGVSYSTIGYGVVGSAAAGSGSSFGVLGAAYSTSGTGVYGLADAVSGTTYGVVGRSESPGGRGVFGDAAASSGITIGVYGRTASPSGYAVHGYATATSGQSYGVVGRSDSPAGAGVYGVNPSSIGKGVWGLALATGGVNYGVYGQSYSAAGYGGYFAGRVHVTGTLSKGGGSFVIDHPLDPEHRVLRHSFVESPDMMNVYNGNVTADGRGYATVELPAWFEALNRDFRYQLTVIGQTFAQAIVAEEVRGNRFVIRTSEPGVRVSWQVTGIRRDAWAEENRIVVEEDKRPEQRGRYLHPSAFGLSEERSVDYDREWEERLRTVPAEAERLSAEGWDHLDVEQAQEPTPRPPGER